MSSKRSVREAEDKKKCVPITKSTRKIEQGKLRFQPQSIKPTKKCGYNFRVKNSSIKEKTVLQR